VLAVELGDLVVAAPLAFIAGLIVGWLISSKYRVTKVGKD
jgi:uncharacterized protein YneF (UPF0154 family)